MDEKLRKNIDTIAMVIGIGIMFGYFSKDVQDAIGNGMNQIFGPLLDVLPFHIVILIMAIITGVYSSVIQKYTMDWELLRKNQEVGREIQAKRRQIEKEYREARLEENKYKIKKAEEKRAKLMKEQTEMMRGQSEMMMQQFKPMWYTMPVVIPIFGWLRYVLYEGSFRFADKLLTLPVWG